MHVLISCMHCLCFGKSLISWCFLPHSLHLIFPSQAFMHRTVFFYSHPSFLLLSLYWHMFSAFNDHILNDIEIHDKLLNFMLNTNHMLYSYSCFRVFIICVFLNQMQAEIFCHISRMYAMNYVLWLHQSQLTCIHDFVSALFVFS